MRISSNVQCIFDKSQVNSFAKNKKRRSCYVKPRPLRKKRGKDAYPFGSSTGRSSEFSVTRKNTESSNCGSGIIFSTLLLSVRDWAVVCNSERLDLRR